MTPQAGKDGMRKAKCRPEYELCQPKKPQEAAHKFLGVLIAIAKTQI